MAVAKITVLSFYNYMKDSGRDLFDLLTVPASVNKDILTANVLLQAAEFEVLYSDPYVFRDAIGMWSAANLEKWQRWADAWLKAAAFNPLENKDITIHEEVTEDNASTLTQTETPNLTTERGVSAYDTSGYSNKERMTNSGTDTVNNTGSEDKALTRDVREHGNIGVTSLAQLIEGYDSAAGNWDIYARITQEFIMQHCIMVY